jgi:hypothetical protein
MKLEQTLNFIMGVRFRCRLKDFTERLEPTEQNKLKYKRCYDCTGEDKTKYCYVEAYKR